MGLYRWGTCEQLRPNLERVRLGACSRAFIVLILGMRESASFFLNSAQNPESSYLRCISVIVLLIVLNLEFSGLLCRRYARFFVIECVVGYMSMLQSAPQNGQVAWVWRLACLFYLCLLLLSNWNHKYYWSINVKLNHSVHFTHSDLPRWRLHNWFD